MLHKRPRSPLQDSSTRRPPPASRSGIKRVFKVTLDDEGATPFAFARIWDAWKRPDGTYLETFAIVTTEPNELIAQIHERHALILHPKDYGDSNLRYMWWDCVFGQQQKLWWCSDSPDLLHDLRSRCWSGE